MKLLFTVLASLLFIYFGYLAIGQEKYSVAIISAVCVLLAVVIYRDEKKWEDEQ
jgi:hypothetical protein